MSEYEALSIAIACIAALGTLVVWGGQRKLQRESAKLQQEANDLQRATAELSRKQLEILLREEKGRNAARLSLSLERSGKGFRFRVENVSEVDAESVEFDLLVDKPEQGPLIESEYRSKFPLKRLRAGESISLIAALHLGSPTAFNARMRWTNPDGHQVEEEAFAAL